ncbi:MAG: enolase C-terminal domain-like protein [Bacteroidia bacterium]
MIELLHQRISLRKIEAIRLDIPQKITFTSGIGVRKSKDTVLMRWEDEDGFMGYGEISCRPDPYFSAEFLDASMQLLEKFVFPFLKKSQTFAELRELLGRIRGWNFTRAAVETAAFNVLRKKGAIRFSDFFDHEPLKRVPVGISLGIYDDPGEFREVIEESISQGYRRLKFKISPGSNTAHFDAANDLLFDSGLQLGFDANGSFREDSFDTLGYFVKTYPDSAIEQPTPPRQFELFLRAKSVLPSLKVCWDEEVESLGDLVKLHQLGYADELNLKSGRVGGPVNSMEIIRYCKAHNIPVWNGGMFESGLGRLQNIAYASYMPGLKANDLSPSSRYFEKDLIDPPVTMEDGFIIVEKASECKVLPERVREFSIARLEYYPTS